MIPGQTYLHWRISVTALQSIAIAMTIFRFEYRRRCRRLWWDDYAAILPAATELIYISVLWTRTLASASDDKQTKITLNFLSAFSFITIVWWSKVSLVFAGIRVVPVLERTQITQFVVPFGFITIWGMSLAVRMSLCATKRSWHKAKVPGDIVSCRPGSAMEISGNATDLLANLYLIIHPFQRLRKAGLPVNQRRLIRILISAGIIMLLAAIMFTSGSFIPGDEAFLLWIMMAHIEAGVSIITSNLVVMVSCGYCLFAAKTIESDNKDRVKAANSAGPVKQTLTTATTVVLTEMSTAQVYDEWHFVPESSSPGMRIARNLQLNV